MDGMMDSTGPDATTTETTEWGVALGKALDAPQAVAVAERAEQLGYRNVWVSNERFHRDMFAVLGAIAARTSRVGLGTFVSDPYTVHPAISGAAVATVDRLSSGRALFAVGAGGSGFPELGIAGTKPLRDLEAMVTSMQRFLGGELVSVESPGFRMTDARLADLPARQVPLILASQSPKMLRLGGRVADAVMISTFADPRLFEMAVEWTREGAAAAGRDFDVATDVIARIDVAIDTDRAVARDRLRPLIGYLLVLLHPHWWFLDVLGLELPAELHSIAERRDMAAMRDSLALIPAELIDAFGWCGDVEDVVAGAARLAALGVRRFVILPHAVPGTFAAVIEAIAGRVIGD